MIPVAVAFAVLFWAAWFALRSVLHDQQPHPEPPRSEAPEPQEPEPPDPDPQPAAAAEPPEPAVEPEPPAPIAEHPLAPPPTQRAFVAGPVEIMEDVPFAEVLARAVEPVEASPHPTLRLVAVIAGGGVVFAVATWVAVRVFESIFGRVVRP